MSEASPQEQEATPEGGGHPYAVRVIAAAFAVAVAVLTMVFWLRMPPPTTRTWLDVRSTPAAATVLIEGAAVGETPFERLVDLRVEELLTPGRVEVELAGHRVAETQAGRRDGDRGARVVVEVKLVPGPR